MKRNKIESATGGMASGAGARGRAAAPAERQAEAMEGIARHMEEIADMMRRSLSDTAVSARAYSDVNA